MKKTPKEIAKIEWQGHFIRYKNLHEQDPDGYYIEPPIRQGAIIHDVLGDAAWIMRKMIEQTRIDLSILEDGWENAIRMTIGNVYWHKETIPTHTAYMAVDYNYRSKEAHGPSSYKTIDLTPDILKGEEAEEHARRLLDHKRIIRVWLDLRSRRYKPGPKMKYDNVMARLQSKPMQVYTTSYRVALGHVDMAPEY